MAIFAIRTWRSSVGEVGALLIGLGIALAVVLLVAFLVPDRKVEGPAPIEFASDYPVPPLDLAVPQPSRHELRPEAVSGPPLTGLADPFTTQAP